MMQHQRPTLPIGKLLFLLPAFVFACALTGIAAYAEEPAAPVAAAAHDAIYLNGKTGNDANDGLTEATAVKTFGKAKEMAVADHAIKTIYVTGTVRISGQVNLDGTEAVVMRAPTFGHYLFQIAGDTDLSDITIDGNRDHMDPSVTEVKALIDCSGAHGLTIADGTVLQNNRSFASASAIATGGAIQVAISARAQMTGGIIQNNSASWGGGIYVNSAKLVVSGGIIRNNTAVVPDNAMKPKMHGYGGGICGWNGTFDESFITVTGGARIENNDAAANGGGISLGTNNSSNSSVHLTMDGGEIVGNSAGNPGGGIFLQAGYRPGMESTADITGGRIASNRMTNKGLGNRAFGGGGIYVNGFKSGTFTNAVLHLKNALIRNNSSVLEGGGLAACPISKIKIHVKEGVAIYQNEGRREKADQPANDIYVLASNDLGAHSGDPEYEIAPMMLGGVPYLWTDADGVTVPLNKLQGQLSGDLHEELILNTAEVAAANTLSLGKVIIENNWSATRGGGIGANGTLIFGDPEPIDIEVTKEWMHVAEEDLPESIRVGLYVKAEGSAEEPRLVGYETMKRGADGTWKLVFTQLPKTDGDGNLLVYSVKEEVDPRFIPVASGNQDDGFKIVNWPTTSIEAEKSWKGIDPAAAPSVEAVLLRDGEPTGQTATLDAANGWKASFENLPAYDQETGRQYVYTVAESGEKDGQVKIDGKTFKVAYDGTKIENEFVEEPPIEEPPVEEPPSEETPDTGDTTAGFGLLAALFAVAGTGLVVASRKARR